MKRAFVVFALCLCACASQPVPLTEFPESLTWCKPSGPVPFDQVPMNLPKIDVPMSSYRRCEPIIGEEASNRELGTSDWMAVFGVTIDSDQRVADLCVLSANVGNTPRSLACVARQIRRWKEPTKLEPGKHPVIVAFRLF